MRKELVLTSTKHLMPLMWRSGTKNCYANSQYQPWVSIECKDDKINFQKICPHSFGSSILATAAMPRCSSRARDFKLAKAL